MCTGLKPTPKDGEIDSPLTKRSSYAQAAAKPPTPRPTPPRSAASTPPHTHQPTPTPTPQRKTVVIRSLTQERVFIHPNQVTKSLYNSIFSKKLIGNSISITGGGRGLKFQVANLDNLSQTPEQVTRLGEWPVKCWVASEDNPAYHFGRIYPVGPETTM